MVTLTTEQIKSKPGQFIDEIEAGNEVTIVRNSTVVAHVHVEPRTAGRPVYGSSVGKIVMTNDFDAPLPEFAEYS